MQTHRILPIYLALLNREFSRQINEINSYLMFYFFIQTPQRLANLRRTLEEDLDLSSLFSNQIKNNFYIIPKRNYVELKRKAA